MRTLNNQKCAYIFVIWFSNWITTHEIASFIQIQLHVFTSHARAQSAQISIQNRVHVLNSFRQKKERDMRRERGTINTNKRYKNTHNFITIYVRIVYIHPSISTIDGGELSHTLTLIHANCEHTQTVPSTFVWVNNNNQTEMYVQRDSMLLLRCPVFPHVYIGNAHTHTLTEAESHQTHSSLRLNYYWARAQTQTHTHTRRARVDCYVCAVVHWHRDGMLVACVGSAYIVCCLVRYTRTIVASSSHTK